MRDTQDLEYTESLTADEVSNLLAEVWALRAERDENEGSMKVWRRRCQEAEGERDRLRDGIAEHRDVAEKHYHEDEHDAWDLDLWSLLDGEADDE